MTQDASSSRLPWEGQPYSVKRFGVSISNCDTEPVQTPGCIQDHGALLVLRCTDLTILQASENSAALLGEAPQGLLGRPVAAVLGAGGEERVRNVVAREPLDRNPLYVFTVPGRDGVELDVSAHTIGGVCVLEFEVTQRTPAVEPDYYALVKKTVTRLQAATTLQDFCDVAVAEVCELTGLDRVMVYKFHDDGHGEVIAESRRADLAPWRGLHYPAQDIPRPAREIFKQIWVRPVPDVSGGLAELVPLVNPDTGRPLDMTHCALRGASVMYTEYLQNMKVSASLTMPIRRGDELWGLIACHHYAGSIHFPYQMRAACEFVAQVVSLQQRAAEEREQLAYRLRQETVHQQLVARAAQDGDLAAMTSGSPTLIDGMVAGGAALHYQGRWTVVGSTPTLAQLDALVPWLQSRPEMIDPTQPVFATDALSTVYVAGAEFADVASGVMACVISRRQSELILWFRPETMRTIQWGGNPDDKPQVTGPHGMRLTPRASFELVVESVRGRSLPWHRVDIESAARLRLLIMELVVSRAAQLAELNADLARSNEELDSFAYVAGHDLKEPLRGIHKYAHQLLEGAANLEAAQRAKLDALMRLTLRMDSLLESLLHFSRVGRIELSMRLTDMNEIVDEAIEMVSGRQPRTDAQISVARPLPTVRCDGVRAREIFANLLSNALKYNEQAAPSIEIGHVAGVGEDAPPTFFVRDNGIGIEPRHHEQIFRIFRRLHTRDEFGGGAGVGLAIVKKLVDRHGGRVWLESTPPEGTTFFFTLAAEPSDRPE
jgi:light-regulated signal transduction histidine kinase (bacteriophytochrome)